MEMEPDMAKGNHPWLWKLTCLNNQKSFAAAEAIEKLHGGRVISREEVNGVVRVKIVVSKQELGQMVASMSQKRSNAIHHRMAAPSRLDYRSGDWRPAPDRIPEEI